ncbi:MAG: class II aldolase/adducin family protein [Lachnospiraceae bacterium]|nr:class II aldolase/adducin family protein [Lachnospiraceae bacterium]
MLEQLKSEVIRIGRQAQREGLCKHKAGNFSMRDKETGYIVVTPSGVDRELLTVDDMIVIDMNANVIENITGLRPSSEVLMHIAIYEARPDVWNIVHTHSKYATVFATLNRPIPPFINEMMAINNKNHTIPVAPYGRAGTPQLAENVASTLKDADSILMSAHGAVAVDADSIDNAYLKACYIEELAEVYHHILAINGGKEAPIMPLEELQKWAYPSQIKFPNN